MMKPNRLNVTAVSARNSTIQNGCSMCSVTKKFDVEQDDQPMVKDLVAAAPDIDSTTSKYETGAESTS